MRSTVESMRLTTATTADDFLVPTNAFDRHCKRVHVASFMCYRRAVCKLRSNRPDWKLFCASLRAFHTV